jgi:hypothetical protein
MSLREITMIAKEPASASVVDFTSTETCSVLIP